MKCEVCGKEIEKSSYSHKVLCSSKCFDADYWLDRVKHKDDFTIIDGVCYHIENENSKSSFRGFGGKHFTIIKNTGERIETTNLWYNGEIPKAFLELLPDNARFEK